MKPKKKTHEEARRSHLALQARRDALVKMRKGEIITIRLAKDAGGRLITARALAPNEWPTYYMCLAIINKRLRADWCSDKDGLKVGPRRLDVKDTLGVVLTVDGKDAYEGEGSFWEGVRRAVAAGTEALKESLEGSPVSR